MIRAETMVSGGRSRSATPTKKNEPPHRTDSATSRHHAPASRDEEGDIGGSGERRSEAANGPARPPDLRSAENQGSRADRTDGGYGTPHAACGCAFAPQIRPTALPIKFVVQDQWPEQPSRRGRVKAICFDQRIRSPISGWTRTVRPRSNRPSFIRSGRLASCPSRHCAKRPSGSCARRWNARTVAIKQGKTRIEAKCGKCGAPNRLSAPKDEVRVKFTCKECGHAQHSL